MVHFNRYEWQRCGDGDETIVRDLDEMESSRRHSAYLNKLRT
jgi:hypothetical protein